MICIECNELCCLPPLSFDISEQSIFPCFQSSYKKNQKTKQKEKEHYELNKNRKPFLETSTLSSFRLTRPRKSILRFRIGTFGTFCTFRSLGVSSDSKHSMCSIKAVFDFPNFFSFLQICLSVHIFNNAFFLSRPRPVD